MSSLTSFFKSRKPTAECHFRLVVMPNFSSDDPSIMHLLVSSFEEAVRTKVILGHTFLFLTEQRLMTDHPNAFFIDRFDSETQEWVNIDEDDSPSEHGLASDAESVSAYEEEVTQTFLAQRGIR